MSEIFVDSKWIWAKDNHKCPDTLIFRRSFRQDKLPKKATARIAAVNRYFLSVNGKAAVVDGGLRHERGRDFWYYDEIDITKLLVKGENVISAVVIRDTVSGENTESADASGFLFECPELNIVSDKDFSVFRNNAYEECGEPSPSGKISGSDIRYDATRESMLTGYKTANFVSNIFEPAEEYGSYVDMPWSELVKRPIPFFSGAFVAKERKPEKESNVFVGTRYADVYTVKLPRAMYVYPYFSVSGNSGDMIEIRTDKYFGRGGYTDEGKLYNGFRAEYIMRSGKQEFESPQCLFGEKLIFSVPASVKVFALGYRESAYDSKPEGMFSTDGMFPETEILASKCENTLKCCMRSSFADAPERSETLMPAAAAVGAECALYHLDENGLMLVEKTVKDMLLSAKNDIFYVNAAGESKEYPIQNLIALSRFGLFSCYFDYVGDSDLLHSAALAALRYLAKWDMASDGFVKLRADKCDELFNCDNKLIENALYLSALDNTLRLCERAGGTGQKEFITDRMESISEAVRGCYDGVGYTTVKEKYDDRANALAVLCEIAAEEQKSSIADILKSTCNATPLYEGFVLEALFKLGYGDVAYDRMCARYYKMTQMQVSTLGEEFFGGGANCHLASVKPLSLMYRYLAGIEYENGSGKITVTPDLRRVDEQNFVCRLKSGRIKGSYRIRNGHTELIIENGTNAEVNLVLYANRVKSELNGEEIRTVRLGKGKNKFAL